MPWATIAISGCPIADNSADIRAAAPNAAFLQFQLADVLNRDRFRRDEARPFAQPIASSGIRSPVTQATAPLAAPSISTDG